MRLWRVSVWLCAALQSVSVAAQDISAAQIGRMLVHDLSPTRAMESGEWFMNDNRTYALGVIYVHVPGSAGTESIHAGIYGFLDSGWVKLADVTGLHGHAPTNAVFDHSSVRVTTLTLGPGDPRCCPSR